MQTAVRKSTRLEYKPPKLKHLTTLKNLTVQNPENIPEILKALEKRLKEGFWIITFKVFIVLHYLIREGNYAGMIESTNVHLLDMSQIKNKKSAPETIQTMLEYKSFIHQRIVIGRASKVDYTTLGTMRRLSLSNGLFEETRRLQQLLNCALNCNFRLNEGDPSISIFAYQLTIHDILSLFQAMNEAIINILEHYFEMSVADAKEALGIYKVFAKQTKQVKDFLDAAKMYEYKLQMRLPPINHAPVSLVSSLEEYLDDLNKPAEEPKEQAVYQQPLFTGNQVEPLFSNQPTHRLSTNNPFATLPMPSRLSTSNSVSVILEPNHTVTNPFSPTYSPTMPQPGYDTNPFRSMRGLSSYQNPFSSR